MSEQWLASEQFWHLVSPIMFSSQRWATAGPEVEKILSLLQIEKGCDLLDLACGPGRHALEFARRGSSVTGVDGAKKFIEEAKKKAAEESLEIQFIHEDMRQFVKEEAYDLVVNLFTSFGYFEDKNDDLLVLKNVHRSLRENGVLFLDLAGKEIIARVFKERDWSREDDDTLLVIERQLEQNWSWIVNRWFIVKNGETKEITFSHRLYSAEELSQLVKEAGFASVDVYGSLDGQPYDHKAQRLIVIANK